MINSPKIWFSILVILFAIGGYFLLAHSDNSERFSNSPKKITEALVETIADSVTGPVGLTPKKENNIPPPEPPLPEGTDRFVVTLADDNEQIAQKLADAGFITDASVFVNILEKSKTAVLSGAYKLSQEMTPTQISQVLHGKPYMKWVFIKEGLRKEEIATILSNALGWSAKDKSAWLTAGEAKGPEYVEGVYYPDTYLIPVDEEPAVIAGRLISKFNEKFVPYLPMFTAKNINWARALTLASIVQREAANNTDMPLIAGILWNRLNQNMTLGVDATLQYARGDTGAGFWAPITLADKEINSPFNTYKYKGLPPHPISNPGVVAIEATLNPAATDCLYYLHDRDRVTHCATTYEEHQENIQKYLVEGENISL